MTANVDDVAAAILERTGEVTTWKLQKLAYYAQAWYLVDKGERLFEDDVEAWRQGPVVRTLYNRHRRLARVASWPEGTASNLDPGERRFVEAVVDRYARFTAESLSRMTHVEAPWLVAREGVPDGARSTAVISTDVMRTFYARQVTAPEDAVALAVANSYLEGVQLDESWQDELRRVADGAIDADTLVRQEIRRIRGD